MKYAHEEDKSQLPGSREETPRGSSGSGRGNPACCVSGGPLCFNSVAYSVLVSGGKEDRDGAEKSQRSRCEPVTRLAQFVLLPNITLKPHKAFIELTQKDSIIPAPSASPAGHVTPKSTVVEQRNRILNHHEKGAQAKCVLNGILNETQQWETP